MQITKFLSWCSAQGIVSPFELRQRQEYRFMSFIDKPEAPSDDYFEVLRVPLDACLTGKSSEALAKRLSQEKALGPDSKYAPWLDLLPPFEEYQETLPRFWTEDRLQTIRDGGALQKQLGFDRKRLEQVEDQWALACVDSRANFLADQSYAMTPLLDMFNHDCSVDTTAAIKREGDDDQRILSLRVDYKSLEDDPDAAETSDSGGWKGAFGKIFQSDQTKPEAGREVYISYGNLSNLETLCNYGFVVPTNPVNVESVQIRVLGKESVTLRIHAGDGSVDADEVGKNAIGKLRGYLATSEDLEGVDPDLWQCPPEALSRRNEVDVYALIAAYVEDALDDAKEGAKASNQDPLITKYHEGREWTLQKCMDGIKTNFPELFMDDE